MKKNINVIGRAVGIVLLCAAVAAVFLYKSDQKPPELPQPVRPVKSFLVGSEREVPKLYFPGTMDAETGVALSFEVSGRLIEFPVQRGQRVKKDAVLARLDDRDFQNQVKNAQADVDLAQSTLARIENALKLNAVSQEDYSRAKADLDKAQAQLDIRRKALEDTTLTARFDGVIADTYVDNFDTIAAGNPVLKLQNVQVLNLVVSVPESYVLQSTEDRWRKWTFSAQFDALPGRSFPVELKEFASTADAITQTYRATFTMKAQPDLLILPGMSGTVVASLPEEDVLDAAVQVPSDAVGISSDGSAFVWVLEDHGEGTYITRQRIVTPSERAGTWLGISSGLAKGEQIAAAGISVLTQGRVVRRLEDDPAALVASDPTSPTQPGEPMISRDVQALDAAAAEDAP
ncbi:MAG: efflux RND transporter periplasmic adaptor subunit [Verrucomicrobiota bacterium]|jgi:RND family efflux transporter MFP subunit|nr:efflux RND transporter periplasmic adaptor subunit [Verrucomicrobiota bacterium]